MPRNRIIVIRQQDGGVKVFVNLCRHRGAMLEEREKGSCRLFSRGYHRWSYDMDGSLRTITRGNMFGAVDKSKHGLVEVPARERHGFVWMVDDAEADIDVAAGLGPEMDGILGGYGIDRSLAVHITETHFLLPNSTLLRQPDHFQLLTFRPRPTEPGRSRMEMRG